MSSPRPSTLILAAFAPALVAFLLSVLSFLSILEPPRLPPPAASTFTLHANNQFRLNEYTQRAPKTRCKEVLGADLGCSHWRARAGGAPSKPVPAAALGRRY